MTVRERHRYGCRPQATTLLSSRHCALLVSFAGMLFVQLGACAARAQVVLGWEAPDGCSDAESFGGAFEGALGAPLAEIAAPGTEVRVRFDDTARWSVSVEVVVRDVVRTRTLGITGGECHDLDDGLVVVIALLVEEAAAAARPPDVAAAPPPPIALRAPIAAPERPLRGVLALGAVARVDALPGLAGGPLLAMEVRIDELLALGVRAAWFPSSSAQRDGVRAEVSAVGAGAFGCLVALAAPVLELGGCGSVDAFLVTATGAGLADPQSSAGLELDLGVDARAAIQVVGPLWLRVSAGIGFAAVRARVYFEALGAAETLHLTSIAFPRGEAVLELRLGD